MRSIGSLVNGYYSLYNAFDGIRDHMGPYTQRVINQDFRSHKQKQKARNKKRAQKASRQKNRR
jgi:hypothetical protein